MMYVTFDDDITRKHGVLVEGWPLPEFKNPSAIGSQVELKVLLNAWNTGTTRFRKMSTEEHMAWVESRANSESPLAIPAGPPPVLPPSQHSSQDPTLVTNPTVAHMPFIPFEAPAGPSISSGSVPGVAKKPRKTRSDKGKPRKRTTQVPGANVFPANA